MTPEFIISKRGQQQLLQEGENTTEIDTAMLLVKQSVIVFDGAVIVEKDPNSDENIPHEPKVNSQLF